VQLLTGLATLSHRHVNGHSYGRLAGIGLVLCVLGAALWNARSTRAYDGTRAAWAAQRSTSELSSRTARAAQRDSVWVTPVLAGAPAAVLGREGAPATLTYFIDHTCLICRSFGQHVLPELLATEVRSGRLRIVVRDFPLAREGMAAALAGRCASAQGRFLAFHQAITRDSGGLPERRLAEAANEAGLDADRFAACRRDPATHEAVVGEQLTGQALGITATPSFILGRTAGDTIRGRLAVGARPAAAFRVVLDSLLGPGRLSP
jgi:protein-disulfide isomerase